MEEAFAASVRLPHGTSLLVDTGAPGNLAGSEWTEDHSRELWSADLPAPHYTKRDQPLACSGVGKGKQEAVYDVEVPIALGSNASTRSMPQSCRTARRQHCLAAFP